MRCTNCGNEVSENAKFCKVCGAKIEVEQNNQKICSNCGKELKANAQFCTGCGTPVGDNLNQGATYTPTPVNTQPVYMNTQRPAETNKTLIGVLIALVAVLVVLIVGVLAYTMMSSGDDGKEPKVEPTAVPTQATTPAPEPKNSSYLTYKKDVTWYQAYQEAMDQGGTLICINDKEEFDKACSLAEKANIVVFWVGARRRSEDLWDETRWLDGRYITYTKWLDGEPTYYSEDYDEEEFLMVFKVNGKWYYNDSINDISKYYKGKIGYIVEIEE